MQVQADDRTLGAAKVLALREPSGTGVRVDSGLFTGTVVGSDYDPMLAKVIAHGRDRADAIARLTPKRKS